MRHLPGFSEKLSPMLVKELRQGLRSPLFVWGLIAMNLFLSAVVPFTMEDPSEESLHMAFFGGYCVLVCGLLPLRAAGALHDELRGQTIDTLILTRLNGWRITLGKWLAVVAQQILVAITVLPYLIVRYFAGGLDIPSELAWLGIFLLAGIGSAAVLTGFSWIRYFLFRAALMMGMTFITGTFCYSVLEVMYGRYGRGDFLGEFYSRMGWHGILLVLAPVVHLAFWCLDLGAAQVGGVVEHRSVRRRLTGLGFVLFYLLLAGTYGAGSRFFDPETFVLVTGVILAFTVGLLVLQALLEVPVNLVSVVTPWIRKGWWGRLASRFLATGWPSGVLYSLFLLGICLAAFGIGANWMLRAGTSHNLGDILRPDAISFGVAGFGAVIGMIPLPLVLWQLFFRRRLPWHLWIYGLLLAGTVSIQMGAILFAEVMENENWLKLGTPIPTMGWSWLNAGGPVAWLDPNRLDWDDAMIALVSGTATVFWWQAALLTALLAFRQTRAVEAEAQRLMEAGQEKPAHEI